MTGGAGFAIGLSCGIGSGIACGIASGKKLASDEFQKKVREYFEQNDIIIQSKKGELISIESFINEVSGSSQAEKIKKISPIIIVIIGVLVCLGLITLFLFKFLR